MFFSLLTSLPQLSFGFGSENNSESAVAAAAGKAGNGVGMKNT